MDESTDQYQRLRSELEAAYAAEHWDSERIDNIARKLISIECRLVREQGAPDRESAEQ
jgi:hypothetical protein